MGIRFSCPNGHKLNVKEHLAGKRGICPTCGAKFVIPVASEASGPVDDAPAILPTTVATFPVLHDAPLNPDANSPSVIISVVESAALLSQPATTDPPTAPLLAPPALDFTATPAVPTSAPPPTNFAIRRARSRRLQMQIAVVLIVAVIVLAIVLVWVLRRGPTEAMPETSPAPSSTTHLAPRESQAYVAEALIPALMPRDGQVLSL